jgi:hypothetical protein
MVVGHCAVRGRLRRPVRWTGAGYLTIDDHGAIGTFGDGASHGSVPTSQLRAPVVSATTT